MSTKRITITKEQAYLFMVLLRRECDDWLDQHDSAHAALMVKTLAMLQRRVYGE